LVDDGVCPILNNPAFFIIEPESAIEWTIVTDDVPCSNSPIDWSLAGNYYVYEGETPPPVLSWYEQGQAITPGNETPVYELEQGVLYNIVSTDANGCEVLDQYQMPNIPVFVSEFNPLDSDLWIECPGDNTGLIAFITYYQDDDGNQINIIDPTYIWYYSENGDGDWEYMPEYDNQNNVDGLPAGSYEVLVNNENDCGPIIHNIEITEPEEEVDVMSIISDYNGYEISCNGASDGSITIELTGGLETCPSYFYNINWFGPFDDVSPYGDQDSDIDGDGLYNCEDLDIDGDGIDNFGPDGIEGNADDDPDIDGDGEYDDQGNCISNCNEDDESPEGVDPDIDGDGILNCLDDDIDGDGIYIDTDGDSDPDITDPDIDGDGIDNFGPDGIEGNADDDPDIDGDGDYIDPATIDTDGDGIFNDIDEDIDGDGIANCNDEDIDGDGIANEDDDDSPDGYDVSCQSNCNNDDSGLAPNDDLFSYGDLSCQSNCNGTFDGGSLDISSDQITTVNELDIDGDGIVNCADDDMDGDGVDNDDDDDIDGDGVFNDNDMTSYGEDQLLYTETVDNLSAGAYIYTVSVDIPEGESLFYTCVYIDTLYLSEPDVLAASVSVTDALCNGGSGFAELTVTGGIAPYDMEDLSSLSAGDYTTIITDANDCETSAQFTVLGPLEPIALDINDLLTATTIVDADCGGDNGGNVDSGEIVIDLELLFSQTSGGTPFTVCIQDWPYDISLIDFGGNTIPGNPNNGFVTFDNIPGSVNGDEYQIVITDSLECEISYSIPVGIINPFSVDALNPIIEHTTCDNNNGSIIIPFGSLFFADPNGIEYGVIDYNISIIGISGDALGFDVPVFSISDGFYIDPDVDGDSIPNAEDGDIDGDGVINSEDDTPYGDQNSDFDLDGINDLNFDSDEIWYQGLPSGDYEIVVVDNNGTGCEASVFVTINESTSPNIFNSSLVSLIPGNCYYDLNQAWDVQQVCDDLSDNGAIEIDPNALPIMTLYPYQIQIDGVSVHPNTGETLEIWDINSNNELETYVIINLNAGDSYSLVITDANGCQYAATYEIPFESSLNVDIIGFCPECQEASNGGFAYTFLEIEDEIEAGPGLSPNIYTASWPASTNNDVDVLYSENSVYDCLYDIDGDGVINSEDDDMDGDGVYDDEGNCVDSCNDDGSGVAPDNDPDIDGDGIDNEDDDSINYNNNAPDFVQVDNELQQYFYYINDQWWDEIPDPNPLITYHQDYLQLLELDYENMIGGFSYGVYQVTIIDQETGCQFVEEIDISDETCKLEFGSQQWNNCLFIPSIFTPNSDGINDLWDIYNIELYEPGVTVKIFNRWGQMVYETNGEYSSDLWDGTNLEGNGVEIATYYYVLELEGFDKNYTGYVVVKR